MAWVSTCAPTFFKADSTRVTDPLNRTTRSGYDGDNRKIASTNAANEVTRQVWNKRNELIQVTDPANRILRRAFDGAGNNITLTNRNGKKWQFQFDAANRMTNSLSPLGRSTTRTINQGLVVSAKEPSGQTQNFTHDSRKRLIARADAVGTTTYRPDANGNVTNVFENGLTNAWTFDAYDRPASFRDVFGNLIQFRRDAGGNVTNLIYPGGKNVYYTLDSHNKVIGVTDWAGRQTTLTRDLNGQVVSITRPNGTVRLLGHDAAGQTTNILERTANSVPIALFKLNWNNAGRVASEFTAPLPHPFTPPTRIMTYDDDNQIATFNGLAVTNDLDGNLTYGPLPNGSFAPYAYDVRNRLLNAGGVTNVYDPLDNRIGQTQGTNTTAFVINPVAALSQVLTRVANTVRALPPTSTPEPTMNATSFSPALVAPFKFPASPYEYKVMPLRECPTPDALQQCDTPDKAAEYWKLHIATHPHFNPECECLAVLVLNVRRRIKGHQLVTIGTQDTLLVHSREVFRLAVTTAAHALILMHCHPSGDPTPSTADIKVTRDLIRAGQLLKIEVLDHVIVGAGSFSSLRSLGHFHA